YAAGVLLGTISLLRGGRTSGAAVYGAILAGYLLQFVGLGLRGHATGGCPLGNRFEIFQFTAWSAITLYLVVGVTFRSSVFGVFTSCLGAVLTLVSLSIPAWDAIRRTHIFGGNPWIELHAALAMFSYGVFGLLALASAMFLLRHFSLKSKHLGGLFFFLPSIMDLDHIEVRLLGAGVAILTAALAFGSVYWSRDTATVGHVKLAATVAVWVAYAAAFGLRVAGRLLARRFAWTCLALFAAALLSLEAVEGSRHPGAAQASERISK
ncbi:MAG TPA: cytochrome c biogenesis protein CcsA, partial [Candidatus Sulfotelmatobacter sp.]|nr:cytochrome c biogenesis protein CcsA [Candidatus Sulfotelmatobacter sp.]